MQSTVTGLTLVSLPMAPLFETALGHVAVMVGITAVLGLFIGRELATPVAGAYVLFIYYATTLDNDLLTSIAVVTLVLATLGIGFKLWRLEGMEAGQ